MSMSDIYYRHAHRSQEEIDITAKRYDLFGVSWIPKVFSHALGLTAVSWVIPDSFGTMHVIYEVSVKEHDTRYILRANSHIPKPEIEMKLEELLTTRASSLGIPANRMLHVDISREHFPFDFQIQEKLLGQDLEDHFFGTKDDYDRISFTLGQYVAKLSTFRFEGFGRFDESEVKKGNLVGQKKSFSDYLEVRLEEDLAFILDAGLIKPSTLSEILRCFETYRPVMNIARGSLVHHDLADHNIMHIGDRITGIFDWDNAVSGDPVLDLASAPTWTTHYPRERMLIDGYASIVPLPDQFQEKMNIYRLRTVIWKTVFVLRAGLMNEKRRQRLYDAMASVEIA